MRAGVWVLLAASLGGLPAAAAEVSAGAALYGRYCATCHGARGQGDGPTARYLTPPPADLTLLADANGGTYPMARVVGRIDGRETIVQHGSPMPFYGAFFEGAHRLSLESEGQAIEVALPVLELARYIETLQR